MEKDQLRAFLYRIATDPTYRDQLESDPVGTFAAMGMIIDPADVPTDGVHLPSNEQISCELDELVERFWEYGPPTYHFPYIWLGG